MMSVLKSHRMPLPLQEVDLELEKIYNSALLKLSKNMRVPVIPSHTARHKFNKSDLTIKCKTTATVLLITKM